MSTEEEREYENEQAQIAEDARAIRIITKTLAAAILLAPRAPVHDTAFAVRAAHDLYSRVRADEENA